MDAWLVDGPDEGSRWLHGELDLPDDVATEHGRRLSGLVLRPSTHLVARAWWDREESPTAAGEHPSAPPGFELAPQAIHLVGEGPWVHEIPARGIDLVIRVEAPDRLPGPERERGLAVLIDGTTYAAETQPDGTWSVRVRGLPPGPLPIAVVAVGHAGRQRTVPATDTGIARLEVTLPTR